MIKRMVIMLGVAAVVLGGIFGFKAFGHMMMLKYMASMGNQPQTVSTVRAVSQDWQPQLEAVASLRSEKGADLSLQQAGLVDSIEFKSGDEVTAGTVLLRLRAADDIAKLHALEAAADLADITFQRDEKQLKVQAVSQAILDVDSANLRSAKAQVAQQQALVDEKTLRAPFSGRLGIRAVDLGQYINAGMTVVTLQNLDSIFADFYLPQESVSRISVGQDVSATVDAFDGQIFKGTIVAIDPKVNTDSRNVQVRAKLANDEHKLLPGMFARVVVEAGKPERHITLPQTVLTYNSFGTTVYVVQPQGTGADGKPQLVSQQIFVTTGPSRGDQVAILKGLKEGDTVVSAGQIKLRSGAPVVVNNSLQPLNDPHPTPQDN
jgi:membrane fusion protein (multidrug efflux system)